MKFIDDDQLDHFTRSFIIGGMILVGLIVGGALYVEGTDWKQTIDLDRQLERAQGEEVGALKELVAVEQSLLRLETLKPDLNTEEGATAWLKLQTELATKRDSLNRDLLAYQLSREALQDTIKLRNAVRSK